MDKTLLDTVLVQVTKPARYMGNELNMIEKDPDSIEIRYAFAFPDIYEVGMSHLGMKILYHLMNERDDTYCERVFAPWVDMEDKMREYNIPLFSLETKDSIKEFDFLGFTLQYEMSYSNVLNMLELSEIPLTWTERTIEHPFVMAGGPCAYNPEPLADFMDLVVMGEGEEVIHEILDLYKTWKRSKGQRDDFLIQAAKIPGVYVPRFFKVDYETTGKIKSIEAIYDDIPKVIKKRIIRDLDNSFYPKNIIVPFMEIVHDRVMLEIFRGCTRGCRFCQAGMIYRPLRERSRENLIQLAKQLVDSTGYEEISLASLSTSDYSQLEDLVRELMEMFREKRVALSLPSLRVDTFSKEFVQEVQKVRKTGLTFAPEAGTQRLRDVINKGVNREDLMNSVSDAFNSGWNSVKLYFMIGLPTENEEDLEGIEDMVKGVLYRYRLVPKEKKNKGVKVTVSTSSFVPKPFTPFQWAAQDDMDVLREKQQKLQKLLRMKAVTYNWHDPELSFLEAVFARGDRRLGEVLIQVHKMGARFDGWDEHFDFDLWMKGFEAAGLDPKFYANRVRDEDEVFPWDHIDTGVNKSFLLKEYKKAVNEQLTVDCRESCSGCGINTLNKGGTCL